MNQDPRPDNLSAALRDRLRFELADRPAASGPAHGLDVLCRWLVSELDLVGATVMVMFPDGPQGVAASSSPEIGPVDSVQFDVGEGPSRDSFTSGEPVLVPDLARSDGRWPGFTSETRARGIEAVYALPLGVGAVRVGVMTSYAERPHVLTAAELATATAYAEVSSQIVLEQGSPDALDSERTPSFDDGVQIRTEVYQAQGMVMVDLAVSLDEALTRMRAAAFADGIPLNDLARAVVAGRRTLTEQDSHEPPGRP